MGRHHPIGLEPKRTKRQRKGKFSLSSVAGTPSSCPWMSEVQGLWPLESGICTSFRHQFLRSSASDWELYHQLTWFRCLWTWTDSCYNFPWVSHFQVCSHGTSQPPYFCEDYKIFLINSLSYIYLSYRFHLSADHWLMHYLMFLNFYCFILTWE